MSGHLDRTILSGYLAQSLSPSESKGVERHLLLCELCEIAYLAITLPRSENEGESEDEARGEALGGAIDHVYEAALGRFRSCREELLADESSARQVVPRILELEDIRLEQYPNPDELRSWRLCELLLETSFEFGFKDPERALRIAQQAHEVSRFLEAAHYGEARLADLRARCLTTVANASRTLSDFRHSEAALAQAEEELLRGTGDLLEEANFLESRASLRREQKNFSQAEKLLEETLDLYRLLGERALVGRTLIRLGVVLGYDDRPEEAISVLGEALETLDAEAEPRLDLFARHNLICFLIDAERLFEAQAMFSEARRLHRKFDDRVNLLRLEWLEARIADRLDQPEVAEAALLRTREGFIDLGVGYDAALVSLELAALYAGQGRHLEVQKLADEMLPIFQSRDIHRDALASLIVFQQAALRRQATAELVEKVAERFRGAQSAAAAGQPIG